MKRILLMVAATLAVTTAGNVARAHFPVDDCPIVQRSYSMPWHNAYYDPAVGAPMALVVPPTAEFQSNYGWGVGGTRTSYIYHQFGRNYPGDGGSYGGFSPTPNIPSDTQQFGVYYVRGPWGPYR